MSKLLAPDLTTPETRLSTAALQQGYKWTAEAFSVDEQQELTLSLQTALQPNGAHKHLAEVVPKSVLIP